MRLLLATLVAVVMLLPFCANSQTGKNKFKEATIVNKDQSIHRGSIDAQQFLVKGRLSFSDTSNQSYSFRDIYSIQIDSNIYWFKTIRNRKDSVAVLIRAIEGKVSVYSPPLESGLAALFVEKDGAAYELQQKVVYQDDKKFYRNEYRQFLQTFFLDCPAITKEMIDRVPFTEKPIMTIVSQYNKTCGWEKENRSSMYRGKFHFGIELETFSYNSRKGAYSNYFEGNRPATAFGFGAYARLDFARRKTSFLISELTFAHISGGGPITYYVNVPVYQVLSEDHKFDITELRNTYSFYFDFARIAKISLAGGVGLLFQYQLSNKSTVQKSTVTGSTTQPSVSSNDKLGISPVGNVLATVGRIGVGYQLVALALQLKAYEGPHLEHKFFLQTRLTK
jgi:hypothetical protein